jgi:hypothetical protein
MVPLTRERRLRVHAQDGDVSFTIFRAAAESLPTPDAPLLDRLFALECLLRGGREARTAAQGLLAARREADWYLDQEWEPDVPHLAALGQAISTIDAAGEDPPAGWPPRLAQTAAELATRPARFGLASSPALLACVLRGLGAADLAPSPAMLDAASAYLATAPDPIVAAQLAEALARHRTARDLARQALLVTFTSTTPTHASAVARWWLAERWHTLRGEPAPVAHNDLEDARTQALCAPPTSDAPIPAMLAEVAAHSISRLVIVPAAALSRAQEMAGVHTIIENLVWRVLFIVGIAAAVLVNLPVVLGWLLPGPGVPPKEALQAAVGLITITVGATTAVLLRLTYRKLGRQEPSYLELLTGAVAAVGTLLAVVLYK